MFVYYFRHKEVGKIGVMIAKTVGEPKETVRGRTLHVVDLDPEFNDICDPGNKGHMKKWIVVPKEEGKVYRRVFWLNDYDLEKAEDIINDYLKEKWLEQRKKLERMSCF